MKQLVNNINNTARAKWQTLLEKSFPKKTTLIPKSLHFSGPYENAGYQGVFIPYPPEEGFDPNSEYPGKNGVTPWQSGSVMDHDRETWSVYYIHLEVEVKYEQIAEITIGSEAIVAAWINEEQTLYRTIPHPGIRLQYDYMLCHLKPGVNTILVKIHSGDDPWNVSWQVDILDTPDNVTWKLNKLIEDCPDNLSRILSRFALLEIYASAKKDEETRLVLESLKNDAFATEWDKAWVNSFEYRLNETGSFQPFQDVPVGYEPVTGIKPYPNLWPQSPRPAKTLYILDVSSATPQEEFAFSVLQGLVNRKKPSLYLLHTRYDRQDREWLEELHFEGYTSKMVSQSQTWDIFRDKINGSVIYDGSIMDNIGQKYANSLNETNVVMMIGSIEDAVPVTPQMNEKLNLPVIFDVRGKWSSQYEMMHWAYTELYPKMNHNILATCYPGIFLLTDYLVSFKIFTFWFPMTRTLPEENLLRGILASTPPNTPIIGWWFDWMPNVPEGGDRMADAVLEEPGLLLGSFFGKILTPSHEATNLTIHSGVETGGYKHKKPNVPKLDPDKVYYTHIMSDGDNLGEALMLQTRELQWDKTQRGSIPMGWSFAPSAAMMAPTVLNYYLRTASENDLLVGGLGVGYTEPIIYLMAYPEQREELYTKYALMTEKAMSSIDTSCLWLINGGNDEEDRYAKHSTGQLKGIFTGYGGAPSAACARVAPNDVVACRSASSFAPSLPIEERVEHMAGEIREAATRGENFIEAWVLNWNWSMDRLQEVQKSLGPDFVCVRPDVLVQLRLESEKNK
ncbi:MAG: GxGYxYP family putative glycoside hydrolase [Spirochaetaceae bacterium]